MKKIVQKIMLGFSFVAASLSATQLHAATEKGQIQINGAFGLVTASDGFGTSFSSFLEPEYFVTDKLSIGLQLNLSAGRLDSLGVAGRARYYFQLPNIDRFNLFAGLGIGYVIDFGDDRVNFGDAHLAVVGFQYDINQHFKLGSDISLNLFFTSHDTAFGARIMPLVAKWAF